MIDRLAPFLLLAGCVFFVGILAAEMTERPAIETEAAAAVRDAPRRAAASPAAVRSKLGDRLDAMVAAILARPLFSATRRPPARNDGPTADSSLDDARLAGIVTEPGHRFAIFAPSGAKALIVTEGDTVSGWRVESITPREVSLSGPDGTKTLQPKIDPTLAPPAPPAVTAPPSPGRPINPAAAASPRRPAFPPPAIFNPALLRSGQLRPGQLRPGQLRPGQLRERR